MATIYYIEDERELRDLVAGVLDEEGHEVITAADGLEGMELIGAHRPDLIISDINIPNMGGRDLLAALKIKFSPSDMPPLLFLTALFDNKDKAEGLAPGAVDYLTKPVDFDLFIERVEALLKSENSPAEPELQSA